MLQQNSIYFDIEITHLTSGFVADPSILSVLFLYRGIYGTSGGDYQLLIFIKAYGKEHKTIRYLCTGILVRRKRAQRDPRWERQTPTSPIMETIPD